jgi:chromosome segregation ATPase
MAPGVTDDLLADYRASAAHRAERVTQLVSSLESAKTREARLKTKVNRTSESNAQLQVRLTQAQARITRLQERVAKLEARGARTSSRATGLRPQAERFAKKVVRRLGARAAVVRGRGAGA